MDGGTRLGGWGLGAGGTGLGAVELQARGMNLPAGSAVNLRKISRFAFGGQPPSEPYQILLWLETRGRKTKTESEPKRRIRMGAENQNHEWKNLIHMTW